MDDLSIFGNRFESCLTQLGVVLECCEHKNLLLNWEKSHFIVRKDIVLGHKVSSQGMEVDKAKVELHAKYQYPKR